MLYRKPPFGFFFLGSLLVLASGGSVAHAEGVEPAPEPAAEPPPDKAAPDNDERRYAIDRTWVYGDDARVPLPLTVIATTSASYTNVGNSPTRVSYPQANVTSCMTAQGVPQPCYSSFAGNTAQPGVSMLVGGELGLLPRLSIQGNMMTGLGGGTSLPNPNVGGTVSLRFSVFPGIWENLHLVVSAGYVREAWGGPVYDDDAGKWLPGNPNGDNGMFLQAAIRADIARLRLGGMLHGEHIFADGRDPVDVMVDVGASYLLVGTLRAGIEYVGQDLEETFSPGAEGGARHFLGPIASAQFFGDRLTLVVGPSVGLSRISPDFAARAGASLGF
jgi:hypothetical protein